MGDSEIRDDMSESSIITLRKRVEDLEHLTEELEHVQAMLHKSDEEEHIFASQLQSLVEITNELSMTESVDELCERTVELGCSRLGFDRLGIWFLTDEPNVITGSYGTDDNGEICDEHGKHSKVNPEDPDGRVLVSKEPLVLTGEAPLVDSYGKTIGHASQAFAALWDGTTVIGHISTDNTISKRPLTKHQCDLLRLLGSVLGNLCTRKKIEAEREGLIDELREALGNIKTLHGLIPICCRCSKLRDDKGYWKRLEVYLHDHSDADFSHGLCPACAKELYPDLDVDEIDDQAK